MNWQTLLRAAVPFGAALLALVALVGATRQRALVVAAIARRRSARSVPPAPADEPGRELSFSTDQEGLADAPKARHWWAAPRVRLVGAALLVVLILATGLVFFNSRTLADVDISSVVVVAAPCTGAEECQGKPGLSVQGTLGGLSPGQDVETLYVLVRPSGGDDWSIGAETRPEENGDWRVEGMRIPEGAEGAIDVRAVAVPRGRVLGASDPSRSELLPRSRVVRSVVGRGEGSEEGGEP